jgi:hypothetical protein
MKQQSEIYWGYRYRMARLGERRDNTANAPQDQKFCPGGT